MTSTDIRPLILAVLIGLTPGCATVEQWAGSLQERWESRNLSQADGLYLQGLKLSSGKEGPVNYPAAVAAFRGAAEQGHVGAQHLLGMSYYTGRGVTQDFRQALRWLEPAAEQGHPAAQYFVGDIYLNGRAVPRERAWGVQWFGRSAAKGYRPAQFALGVAYAGGLGVAQDRERAWFWLWLAGRAGEQTAPRLLEKLAPQLPVERRAQAEALARRWRPEASEPVPHPALVRFVQAQLNRQGIDAGAVDGLMGPHTREAIAAYRRARGLTAGRGVTEKLLAQLRGEAS